MTTRKMPGNQLIRDIFPSQDKITERAACSSIGGSSDIRIDIEVGVPIDSNADNDILRRVNSCDGSLGLSGGRAEHVSPRERRIHIDQYRQSILAQIVPGNPFPLIPHCAFSSGTLVAFDPCVSVVPRRADGSLSCLSRSVGVCNTVGIRNHESADEVPDPLVRILGDAFLVQGAAANSKAKNSDFVICAVLRWQQR